MCAVGGLVAVPLALVLAVGLLVAVGWGLARWLAVGRRAAVGAGAVRGAAGCRNFNLLYRAGCDGERYISHPDYRPIYASIVRF
eukprot:SAG31_NODE_5914_length_2258_cov_2.765632_1_plen_84_part_00